ncbi:Ig-like domain-containing protein [Mariniflexile gromovii]|uniref:Ig-like domain-containing protein n=1 Tax=Mariniflexile gromovii TaxID=362523 RepID=A0ABS4BW31_9FLAO|nr:Ig-like domain-containing protein [Mariniflexile gromovii]MBP0904805.1 Ig-like domain-containing protein [Mariniflexile gromovii]
MNKTLTSFILLIFLGLVFVNCANRGTPEGGPKDETPPRIVNEIPKNFNTNFNAKVIKIYFDEYVKIKDVQKQLIISPPMNTQPEITPLGGASKYITIKIFDTLQPNTTYAFNFGNSITDNNEGNPFPYYRYVFSTGSYIDSLSVKGNIVDALKRQPETFVNVALYEVDSTFTDSIIYKEKPKYITNTLDSVTTFSIDNIKAGKYMLMALKDGNGDNKFQQKTDQIGYYKSFITVPTDSSYTLRLFKEELDFKANRPQIAATQKIAIGYEGDFSKMKVNVRSEIPADFNARITKDAKTDTLYYWYKPKLEVDSLILNVTNTNFDKDYTVKIRKQKKDSLTINGTPSGSIGVEEPFKIRGSIPFVHFDASKVNLINKDSTKVDFTTVLDSINNTYVFNFKKTDENNYKMRILPEAFTDFFDNKNDTLNFSLSTRKASDFGFVRFTLVNANYPLIIQLTTEKGEVKAERHTTKPETVDFLNLQPSTYYIRVIHDANGNGRYDSGSYLKKIQPERVSHFKEIEVRADWGYPETLEFISD